MKTLLIIVILLSFASCGKNRTGGRSPKSEAGERLTHAMMQIKINRVNQICGMSSIMQNCVDAIPQETKQILPVHWFYSQQCYNWYLTCRRNNL